MTFIRITKIFHFEMAHLLQHHDGLCKNIHGHSYRLDVCAGGTPINKPGDSKDGMILDFGSMKKLVMEEILDGFDHALVVNEKTEEEMILNLKNTRLKVVSVPFEPTSENLVAFFARALHDKMPPSVKLLSLKLYETRTAFAEWVAEDNN